MTRRSRSRRPRWLRSIVVAIAVAGVIVTATGGPASAHAAIVEATPEPGSTLGSTPGVVRLNFSEPLNTRLSRARVEDPAGGVWEGRATGEHQIAVRLETSLPGVYAVAWSTVSTVDGHTLRGEFRFGVGVSPGEGAEGITASDPRPYDLALAVVRAVEYLALLLAIGMLVVGALGKLPPSLEWVHLRLRPALAVALGAGLVVIAGEALAAGDGLSTGAIASYLTTGTPGAARVVRLVAELVAVAAARRVRLAGVALLVALGALSSAGHAAAVRPAWYGVGVDLVHLLSAGIWVGGILTLARIRPPSGWRGPEGQALLGRFSPFALTGFAVTALAGGLRGFQELAHVGDLISTSYGRVLSAKVLVVAAMIPLSVLAWRRLVGSLRAEATLAVVVIALAAVLAAYPLPPGRAEPDAAEEAAEVESALPRMGDLTLGGRAGNVLVGLTVRPARPGPNTVLAYVLPREGEDAAAPLEATLVRGSDRLPMTVCGPTCRETEIQLEGKERLGVEVSGQEGGTAEFALPSLPVPRADDLLERMQETMHELRSLKIEEVLGPPPDPALVLTYLIKAPDRMDIRLSTGYRSIQIGDVRYRRTPTNRKWEASSAPTLKVPLYIWDRRDFVAARILGETEIDGEPTTVVSFQGGGGIAIWFRLWIDDDGLVRRAEMRAQGHFMDHTYSKFNRPIEIEPPL